MFGLKQTEVVVPHVRSSLLAGAAGATALTVVHQVARLMTSSAPRMDVIGMRALRKVHRFFGRESAGTLHIQALAGDLIANSAYYSLVGAGNRRGIWSRGLGLGALAGLGAVTLPRRVGLGDPPHGQRRETQFMTVTWYVIGGLVAAAVLDAGPPESQSST